MFAELVELGKRIRKGHDALEEVKCNWDIDIDKDGNYLALSPCDILLEAEKLPAKKGRARLLLDKFEETFGKIEIFPKEDDLVDLDSRPDDISAKDSNEKETLSETEEEKKHNLYINKLYEYANILELTPVFLFYNKSEEQKKAYNAFKALDKKKQKGNLTFRVDSIRLLSEESVKNAIKRKYDDRLSSKKQEQPCAICGTDIYPILDEPHGSVKLPKGQTAGSMLVSYNTNAFESYNLKGNLNSGICTNCARNYIEALRYLVGNGHEIITDKGERKFRYSNRQKISDDTIALFWTKEQDDDIDPFSDICQPTEERVRQLFKSIVTGEHERVNTDVENFFYCCTISSAAARIAVRDWMAISVSQYQKT